MDYGNKCTGDAMGHNAGMGNRSAAESVKAQHKVSKHATDWVSSRAKPMRSGAAPGASASVLKTPRTTKRPIDS